MTIQTTFQLGGERMIVRVIENNVLFIDLQNNMMSPIEGLNLNKQGVILEYPDLKDNPNWKQIAIQRFVDKIKSLPTEKGKMDWLILEMKQMGYTPLFMQRSGFRPQKIK
jgi:hypothetical protein